MRVSNIKLSNTGNKSIKGLLDDGTILSVGREYNRLKYSVDRERIKHTGISNKLFNKHFSNFAILTKLIS